MQLNQINNFEQNSIPEVAINRKLVYSLGRFFFDSVVDLFSLF